ncbi:hypothetical protein SAY87_027642 [Trapa incisa]|uniref:Uncharacterized protein n=1 Tax=Trapa incisa TaxID=236973 RepID=A0AAN7JNA1_9MYRT|nr:hypothetical protein SAY87_027642 [Trapa incisa]
MELLQSREIKSTSTVIESHFTHPYHPLHLTDIDKDFECDACNGPGQGRRYRCSACTFDLHERCATCPSTLSCTFHPSHLLTLVLDHDAHRPCTLCGRSVSGLHYTCSRGSTDGCVFNIHPLCTELPRDFSSARKVPVVSCPVVNVQPPPQPTVMYYQNGCLYMAQPAVVTHPCTAYNNSYTSSQQPLVISNSNYYHTRGQTGNYNNGSDYCQPQHQQESSEDLSAYEDYMAGDMENDGSGGGDSRSYSTARGSESTVAASYPTASSNRSGRRSTAAKKVGSAAAAVGIELVKGVLFS